MPFFYLVILSLMSFLFSLVLRPTLRLISRLPMYCLYLFGDLIRVFLEHVIRYRRKVISENLKKAFPSLSKNEIENIRHRFYCSFVDVAIETIALMRIEKTTLMESMVPDEESKTMVLTFAGKRILLLAGHLGNWEWMGQAMKLHFNLPMVSAYHPLHSIEADTFLYQLRSRFGLIPVAMKSLTRKISEKKDEPLAVALVADQAAPPESAHWSLFFGREAAFFQGPGKIAIKHGLPVIYLSSKRVSRGKYHLNAKLLWDGSESITSSDITDRFVKILENDIRARPEDYLWSHRKWKHQKPASG